MPTTTAPRPPSFEARIAEARARLDQHTRDMVAWHFDPATGCPFWLDYAGKLKWDPRREIQCYDDLDKFDNFQDEWLRGGPVRRWAPKGLAGKPIYVFETGGSTGIPKTRVNFEDFRIDYEMYSDTLDDRYFPRGANWLMLGPSGPRRLRLSIEHLAQYRGGISFCIDMDPRWVIKVIKKGRADVMDEYRDHIVQQGLTLLKAGHDIQCMFTTPKLLEAICEKISLVKAGIKGVFCGGTSMTPQFNRFAREELLEGKIDFQPTYGNTLMGLATSKPFDPADNYSIIYHPPAPRAAIEVVEPDNDRKLVAYGQWGRVRLTTLTKELFMPRFLERDEAVRHPPCEKYPWDGAGDVRPFQGMQVQVIEGVY